MYIIMEVGKLYKGISGLTILCTGVHGDLGFSGTVVIGNERYKAGYKNDFANGNTWNNESFELFDMDITTGLKEGVTYNIPKGCKATIKDGKVLVENNTKYIKHEFEGFVRYGKHVEDGRTTIITLGYNGDTEISHIGERPCPDISGCVKEIDEIEFTNAYNTALKNLEL